MQVHNPCGGSAGGGGTAQLQARNGVLASSESGVPEALPVLDTPETGQRGGSGSRPRLMVASAGPPRAGADAARAAGATTQVRASFEGVSTFAPSEHVHAT